MTVKNEVSETLGVIYLTTLRHNCDTTHIALPIVYQPGLEPIIDASHEKFGLSQGVGSLSDVNRISIGLLRQRTDAY